MSNQANASLGPQAGAPPLGGPQAGSSALRPPSTAGPGYPREEVIERSLDRIIEEGRGRLSRLWPDMLATGMVAGFEVSFGVLALLLVAARTHSTLLGGLAFSIGFIGLRLGHSELFTEGFLVPVTTVAAGEARTRNLLRLWGWTLLGNLAGGWLVTLVIDQAFPGLRAEAVRVASYYVMSGINARTFCLGALAGGAITLMTRMHNGTDSEVAKLIASVSIAFLLAGVRLFHSVLDSLVAFCALNTFHAPFGYLSWLGWFAWVAFANVVGGLSLTTLLQLIRSRRRLLDHRAVNDLPPVPAPVATLLQHLGEPGGDGGRS
jgi:formate/nitrite transporter FocA (FNT family)